jgi:xylulokinase
VIAPLLIGVDVGTTRTKVAAFDLQGRMLAAAQRDGATRRPRPGWAEQDPDAWLAQVQDATLEVLAALPGAQVGAIGVCSQVNTHVFADADLRALQPAITWQDLRAADAATELSRAAGEAVAPSALLARARWLQARHPAVWSRTRWILSPKDYVNAHLTGSVATDPVSSYAIVEPGGGYRALDGLVAGVQRRLPPLGDLASVVGRTREGGRLPAGIPLAVATMDAWGGLYGSGAVRDGDAFELSGTSEVLGVLHRGGPGAEGVVAFPPYDGVHLVAGPTQAGGDALRWHAEVCGVAPAEVLARAARAPAGSEGVVFLPHLAGERAPVWDPDLRGTFLGLGAGHGQQHLSRALLEGVAYSARHVLETLEAATGAPVPRLAITGGAAASDLWCQIKADILDRPLVRLAVLDSGVLGAALMGGAAAGLLDDLRSAARALVHPQRTFEPQGADRAVLDAGYATYRAAQAALAPVYRRRAGSAAD